MMNIIPEISEVLIYRHQMQLELDDLNRQIAAHPRHLHEELSVNLHRLKKNLSGTLVSETVTNKRHKNVRKSSLRAPRGMRQWMLYASIKDCANPGNSRDNHNYYFFNLADIWDRTLERLYHVSDEELERSSLALREDFETFQSSSRTRISSDDLFESEPQRGRYRIVDYRELISSLNKLEENRPEFESYLNQLQG